MAYVKKVWKDAPDTSTPINAANLNHMEDGIAEADVSAQNALDRLDDVDDEITQINSDLTPSTTKYISATYSDQYFESCCVKVGKLVVCSVMSKCSNTLNNTTVLYGRLPYAVKELLEFGWTPLAQNVSFSATSFVNSNSKDINLQISGIYNANTYMRANFVYVTNE